MTKKVSNYMTFGERIVYARNKKGLQQKQLAELIGVGKDTLGGWERGIRDPDLSMIRKIVKVLEVSEDWLRGKNDKFSMKNLTENSQYIKLTKEQQQLVADNEMVIGAVFKNLVKHNIPNLGSYDDFYGIAAIALCRSAICFDKSNKKCDFFVYAFVCVKNATLQSHRKEERYSNCTTSINKIIWKDDSGDVELGSLLSAPDEWSSLEYKILVESLCQKVEPVLTAIQVRTLRSWLTGSTWSEIAKEEGVPDPTIATRIAGVKKKCRKFFNADEIFYKGGETNERCFY